MALFTVSTKYGPATVDQLTEHFAWMPSFDVDEQTGEVSLDPEMWTIVHVPTGKYLISVAASNADYEVLALRRESVAEFLRWLEGQLDWDAPPMSFPEELKPQMHRFIEAPNGWTTPREVS